MAILGLLILAVATALGVETVLNTRGAMVDFSVYGAHFSMPLASFFLCGALLMAVAVFGAFLVTGSLQRRRRQAVVAKHRRETEQTETRLTDVDRTNAELVEENDRLTAELAAERRAAATMGGVAVPPGTGSVAYGDQVSDAVRSDTIAQTGRFEPYPGETVGTTDGQVVRDVDLTQAEEKADVVGKYRRN